MAPSYKVKVGHVLTNHSFTHGETSVFKCRVCQMTLCISGDDLKHFHHADLGLLMFVLQLLPAKALFVMLLAL